MQVGIRNIELDKDQINEKVILKAAKKMLDCFAGSPLRMMIVISLSNRDKSMPDIAKDIKQMSVCDLRTNIKRTLDRLQIDGLISNKDGEIFKLTEKGKILVKIFDICWEVYGDS